MPIRQPVVAVLGHVDHGKTSILDKIRGTTVALREPGSITQWIGASLIPAPILETVCGPLLTKLKFKILIPGLLFIDTPGHETFSNLRSRGGSAADIAILVVDLLKGIEPQTVESIEILKVKKTPFMVAANKIDTLSGWKPFTDSSFQDSLSKQSEEVKVDLDDKIYRLVGALSEYGFNSDRYDRIADFKTHVAIVPTSAISGEGIPDLMAMLVGLTQTFMKDRLEIALGPARGVVLEVKEEVGLGMTINSIIYEGEMAINDTIVIGGKEKPIVTKVRALLVPKPLDEIRDPKDKFLNVPRVTAASGIKIVAPDLEDTLAGSSLYVVPKKEDSSNYISKIEEEVNRLIIKTDSLGIVLKADTLGSLEAITEVLSRHNISIRLADVGDLSRRDVVEAEAVNRKDPILGAVLAFNVNVLPDAEDELSAKKVPLFHSRIIYHLIEEYLEWAAKMRTDKIKAVLDRLVRPGKIRVLKGYIFRRSKPAIVGVEVIAGSIKSGAPLIRGDGRPVGKILRIQDKSEDVEDAFKGSQIAISIENGVVGRNIFEEDILLISPPKNHIDELIIKFKDFLSEDEIELLDEVKNISSLKKV